MTTTLPQRFVIGKELTHHELKQAFQRIFQRPMPRNVKPEVTARLLTQELPLRFEFEVNRLRGFAWEHGELPSGMGG